MQYFFPNLYIYTVVEAAEGFEPSGKTISITVVLC